MHANMLMLHIVHNVWQISDLMEWMNDLKQCIFFFFMIVGKVLLKDAWVLSEYVLQMCLYHTLF